MASPSRSISQFRLRLLGMLVCTSLVSCCYAVVTEIETLRGEVATYSNNGKHLAYIHGGELRIRSRNVEVQVDAAKIDLLVDKLDAKTFEERQAAFMELKSFGRLIEKQLLLAIKESSREQKERLEMLLDWIERSKKFRYRKRVRQLAFSPDDKFIAIAGDDRHVSLWRTSACQLEQNLIDCDSSVHSVAFSANGRWLAVGCSSGQVKVVDLSGQRKTHDFVGHTSAVHQLMFSPDSAFLYSAGGFDQRVAQWKISEIDPSFRTEQNKFEWIGRHDDSVLAIAVGNTKLTLVSGGYEKLIRIWNLQTNELIQAFEKHQNVIRALSVIEDDSLIVSGGDDSTIRFWNISTNEQMRAIPFDHGAIRAISFNEQSKRLAVSGSQQTIVILELVGDRKLLPKIQH